MEMERKGKEIKGKEWKIKERNGKLKERKWTGFIGKKNQRN